MKYAIRVNFTEGNSCLRNRMKSGSTDRVASRAPGSCFRIITVDIFMRKAMHSIETREIIFLGSV